jgi:hypothetical protein
MVLEVLAFFHTRLPENENGTSEKHLKGLRYETKFEYITNMQMHSSCYNLKRPDAPPMRGQAEWLPSDCDVNIIEKYYLLETSFKSLLTILLFRNIQSFSESRKCCYTVLSPTP